MEMIFFDTETTGLLKPDAAELTFQPHITEFYGVKVDFETLDVVDELEFLCKIPVPLEEHIIKITKITEEMLADQPTFAEHYETLAEFYLGVKYGVAHNVNFDMGMLWCELERMEHTLMFPWPMKWVCTVKSSYHIKNRRLRLGQLYEHYFGSEFTGAHRAKSDVGAMLKIYKKLREDGYVD